MTRLVRSLFISCSLVILSVPVVLATGLVLTLLCASASAQALSVAGRVADPHGAAVVNARVTLTPAHGRPLTTRTSSGGTFTFAQLAPGEYVLDVDAPGFVHARQRVSTAADNAMFNVTLQVAGVSENIHVLAEAPATLEQPAFTGSHLGLTGLETPASIHMLTGEAIRQRGDLSVPDAKSRAVGITAQPTPGNGGGGVTARGFGGVGSIMQLYDGGLLFVGSGTVSFPFDTWTIDRIEVLGGPASVMFGTGAIGGVINVVPRKPNPRASEHSIRLAVGSFNTWRAAIDTTGPISPRTSYRLDLSHNRSSGWVDRGESTSTVFSGSLRFDVRPNLTLTFSEDFGYQEPDTYFGVPLINGGFDKSLRRANFNVSNPAINYRDNWTQFRIEWRPSPRITIRSRVQGLATHRYWRNGERYVYQTASGLVSRTAFIEIHHHQRQYGNRTETVFKHDVLGKSNAVSVGFDYNRISFEHVNNAPYGGSALVSLTDGLKGVFINIAGTYPRFRSVSHQAAFFAEDRLALTNRLSLVGGVRIDRYDAERSDLITGARFPKDFTPSGARGGFVYFVRPDVSVYGQLSTATDFIGNLISQSPTQQALDPTTGRQVEFGSKQVFPNGRGEWTVAAYHIVKKKLLVPDVNNPTVSVQVGQQSSLGVEASALFAVGGGVRIEANGTLLRARYDDFFENVGGVPISRTGNTPRNVPERAANVWLTWDPTPRWQARGGIRVVGTQFANDANTATIPGYAVSDAGLRRTITDTLAADLRIYNALDKIYPQTIYGGANQWLLGRPRAVELSLTADF